MTMRISKRQLMVIGLPVAAAFTLLSVHLSEAQTGAGSSDAGQTQQPGLPHPVMGTYQLMDLVNEPLYQKLQQAIQSNPTEHRWTEIQQDALRFAEVANLISIRKAGAEHPQEWQQYCRDLQQAAVSLSHAASERDEAAMSEDYHTLIRSCNDCHQNLASGYSPTIQP